MILSDANIGAILLEETPHSVMYANYHRDIAGISASLEAFSLPPDQVPALAGKEPDRLHPFLPECGREHDLPADSARWVPGASDRRGGSHMAETCSARTRG
jgi:hypothetical protein